MYIKINKKIYHNKLEDVVALKDIELDITNFGLVGIIGASGSGKSTLLNIIGKKDLEYEGHITGDYNPAFIHQKPKLVEYLTVKENLEIALGNENNDDQIISILTRFNFDKIIDQKVNTLSGGQRQVITIIRAILLGADVLLCDEPTSSLDEKNSLLVMNILKEVSKSKLVFIVTHDVDLINQFTNQIMVIEKGRVIKNNINLSDKYIDTKEAIQIKQQNKKYILRYMKHHQILNIISILLIFTLSLTIYLTSNMTQTVQTMTNKNMTWYFNQNVLINNPKESEIEDLHNFMTGNLVYDFNDTAQIKNVLQEDLLGISYGIDNPKYGLLYSEKVFDYINNEISYFDILPTDLYFYLEDYYTHLQDKRITPFELQKDIELIEGNMPKNCFEVVIPQDVATMIQSREGIKQFDLIGKEITFYTYSNYTTRLQRTKHGLIKMPLKIVGIANHYTTKMPKMYFGKDMYQEYLNQVYNFNLLEEDQIGAFHFINLLFDEDTDLEKMQETLIQNTDMHFELPKQDYNDFSHLMILCLKIVRVIGIVLIAVIAIFNYMLIQNIKKQRKIEIQVLQENYWTKLWQQQLIQYGIYLLVSMLLLAVLAPILTEIFNTMLFKYLSGKYTTYLISDLISNNLKYLGIAIVTSTIMILGMMGVSYYEHQD